MPSISRSAILTLFVTMTTLLVVEPGWIFAEENGQAIPVVVTSKQPKELQSLAAALSPTSSSTSSAPSPPKPNPKIMQSGYTVQEQSGGIIQVSAQGLPPNPNREIRTTSNPLRQQESLQNTSKVHTNKALEESILAFGAEEPVTTSVTASLNNSKQTRPIVERANPDRGNPVREVGKRSSIFPGQEEKEEFFAEDIFAGARTKPTVQQRSGNVSSSLKPVPLPNTSRGSSPIGSVHYLEESRESQGESQPENINSTSDLMTQEDTTIVATLEQTGIVNDLANQVDKGQDKESQKDASIMNKILGAPKGEQGRRLEFKNSGDVFPVLTVLGGLCLVLAVFFIFVIFMRRVGPKGYTQLPKEAFENIGRFVLNPKLQLNLLRLGNRLILVAITQEGTVETIAEVSNPDEVIQILGICRKLDRDGSCAQFQSVLDDFAREKTTGGFFGPEVSKRATKGPASTLASLLAGERV